MRPQHGRCTSQKFEAGLLRLPSVWEMETEIDDDGLLQQFYINVETGEVRMNRDGDAEPLVRRTPPPTAYGLREAAACHRLLD